MIAALRFLADEDFDYDIVDGLRRRLPGLDLVRVQEVGLRGMADPIVLERAAQEGRVVLSHDVSTMRAFADARVLQGLPRSEEHTSELQSHLNLVFRLLLE